jgi:hypothetical protein
MHKNSIPFIALGLSGLACALAGMAWSRGEHVPAVVNAADDPNAERLQELADQTAALRAELDHLASARRDELSPRQPMERVPEQASVPPEWLQRLTAIEQSVAALQRPSKEPKVRVEPTRRDPTDLTEARRRATDSLASEQERLAALKALRGLKVGGQPAISRDVVLSMIDLAEHSEDASMREDVYRNLHGVKDSLLRDSMLRALASDPSPKVRQKVAQDIDTFLPDPVVENALRQAADGDLDPGVREQALKTLSGRH